MPVKPDGGLLPSTAPLPLFFRLPHPLNAERHAQAGLNALKDFSFARSTNSVPLNLVEFFEAARSYPIVFTKGEGAIPVALLGMQDENCFLDAENRWLDWCYVPAYVRRYPFIFMQDAAEQRFILCVDEAAPHYVASKAEMPFYTGDGQPSELIQNALRFCTLYQQHHQQTVEFTQALQGHNLLVEKTSNLRMPSGKEITLGGFLVLDGQRFAELPDKVFLQWRKKGWLALADAVLVSYTNWKYLAPLISKRLGT